MGLLVGVGALLVGFITSKYTVSNVIIPAQSIAKQTLLTMSNEHKKRFAHRMKLLQQEGSDSVLFFPAQQLNPTRLRLTVLLLGNGEAWQFRGEQLMQLAQTTGNLMMSMNYPGVGGASGSAWSLNYIANNFEKQIVAVLSSYNLQWSDTTIIGHSIGGYIGAKLVERHPKVAFFSSRSLASLSLLASRLIKFPHFITQPVLKILGWQQGVVSAYLSANRQEYAYAENDNIIPLFSSLHQGLVSHSYTRNNSSCFDGGGHSVITVMGVGDVHNTPEAEMVCKFCKKTLFSIWQSFIVNK